MTVRSNLNVSIVTISAALVLASCSSTPKGTSESEGLTVTQPGVPGGVKVETYKETATVKSIDKATRKITLVDKDGKKMTVTAGPEVVNFAQIEAGDKVVAVITEQLVVFVRKSGEASGDGVAGMVALAPVGEKPAAVAAGTEEVTAKVKSIDVKNQKATLQFPDGTSHTFKVRKDVDLTKQTVGTEVVIRCTVAIALSIEKP